MNKKFWIRFSVMMAIIVAILALDLVTKYVFDATIAYGETRTIIPFLINFHKVENRGGPWGILTGKSAFLIATSVVFLAIFIWYYVKEKNKTWLLNITFGLLIGGCLGNLYDRIFVGYVRDFIQFAFWQTFPVFNFADVALTIGVVLFLVYIILYFVRLKKEEKNAAISVENFDEKKKNDTSLPVEKKQKNIQNTQKVDEKKLDKKQNSEKIKVQKNAKNAGKMQKKHKKANKKENEPIGKKDGESKP